MVLVAVFLEDPGQRVELEVTDQKVKIGRLPEADEEGGEEPFRILWRDRLVNRNHSVAWREGTQLVVERLPAMENRGRPNLFFSNAPHEERTLLDEPLRLNPGDAFSIGKQGRTAFFWLNSIEDLKLAMARQRPFGGLPGQSEKEAPESYPELDYEELEGLDDYSLRLQLRLLQRELPEKVLSGWTTDRELLTKAADFLKAALPGQRGVSVAFIAIDNEDQTNFEILNQDPSDRADFRVSEALLRQVDLEALGATEAYLWNAETPEIKVTDSSILHQVHWIAILPLPSLDGENSEVFRGPRGRRYYLYVEVRQASAASSQALVPFLRLVASVVASLLSARERQRVQDQLSKHFSPALRRILQRGEEDRLKPTLAECTVLFADRRQSSRLMEAAVDDVEILAQLRENQSIVSAISSTVFEHEGVITDFAGDGVLALWGWPVESDDHAVRAATTAESIARLLARDVHIGEDGRIVSPVRMGISTGRIAVGDTGPVQQVHISVFGKVVNFGSRLEGLGKQFRVPCLLSQDTCQLMRNSGKTVRKLCYLRPAGFDGAYPIYELVLPRSIGGSGATKEQILTYEEALALFLQRDWDGCRDLLQELPQGDEPAHWLARQAAFFKKNPPDEEWQGEIVTLQK